MLPMSRNESWTKKGLLCYTTYVLICCKYVNIFCKDLLHNKILFWNCNKPFLCPTLISLINIFMSLITLSCFSKFIPRRTIMLIFQIAIKYIKSLIE